MSDEGSRGSAAGLSAAVVGSMLPFGCVGGCAGALLWLLGGGLIGIIIATIMRHHQ